MACVRGERGEGRGKEGGEEEGRGEGSVHHNLTYSTTIIIICSLILTAEDHSHRLHQSGGLCQMDDSAKVYKNTVNC